MTDLSAVRAATTEAEVRATAEVARKHQCICATTLPSHTPMLRELLADEPEIRDRDVPPAGATVWHRAEHSDADLRGMRSSHGHGLKRNRHTSPS